MSLYVVKDQWTGITLPLNFEQSWKVPISLSTCEKNQPFTSSRVEELIKSVNPQLVNNGKLEVTVTPKADPNDGSPSAEIIIKTSIFDNLYQILNSHGENSASLKMKLFLSVNSPEEDDEKVFETWLQDFAPHPDNEAPELHTRYVAWCKQLAAVNADLEGFYFDTKLDLVVDVDGYLPMSSVVGPMDEKLRNIFLNRRFCDFEIVSKNGTTFPCHKDFLRGVSSVLAATIEGDFTEGKQGKYLIEDMTDPSIQAFLEFVYYKSVEAPIKSPVIAFELLKAADYFNIIELWTAMVYILEAKPLTWYTIDVALEIFEFVLKKLEVEGSKTVKEKIMYVLAVRSAELDDCPQFAEMFPTIPSKDMFKSTLAKVIV